MASSLATLHSTVEYMASAQNKNLIGNRKLITDKKGKTMIKNLRLWSGCFSFFFLLASCASTAHIEKDDNTDFSQFKTFAWLDKDGGVKNEHAKTNDLTERKIKEAVSKELEKSAGWKESKRNPDVLLSYDVLVEKTVQQRSDPVYSRSFTRTFYNPYTRRFVNVFYPSQFMGYDDYTKPSREGTVTITMLDAKTEKTVWQGWSKGEVDSKNISSKEIQSSVKAIFRKFDIAKN